MRAPMQYIHYQDVKLGEENPCFRFFVDFQLSTSSVYM
jgi:hypothetical protein